MDNAHEAILTHLEGLLLDDEIIPVPSSLEELRETFGTVDAVWALSKVDSYAQKKGSTRSGFLVEAALEYMSKNRA